MSARMRSIRPILSVLEKRFPLELADTSWDNVGLLVDCTATPSASQVQRRSDPKAAINVLLTIDLTRDVCQEAIDSSTDLIIAYHPFIFKGLKSISPQDPQQRSLLSLIQHGISVYCPHTAVDAAHGGVNDWLIEGIGAKENVAHAKPIQPTTAKVANYQLAGLAGMGRLVQLETPLKLSEIIANMKKHLGISTLQLVQAPRHAGDQEKIRTIASCAGSGSSVLRGVDADLWITGELSHHEALHLKETGTSALICLHSNSERGYLNWLAATISVDLSDVAPDFDFNLAISDKDHDPISYV